jgi:hypothetical protein
MRASRMFCAPCTCSCYSVGLLGSDLVKIPARQGLAPVASFLATSAVQDQPGDNASHRKATGWAHNPIVLHTFSSGTYKRTVQVGLSAELLFPASRR